MNVEAGPRSAALFHCDQQLFRRQAANRPHRVGGVHRIGKDHRFIGGKVVQLVFILLDEGRLFRRVQLA